MILLLVLLPGGSLWRLSAPTSTVLRVLAGAGIVLMVVAGLSLGRGLTALPLPNEHARLRTNGPYRYARHPIYSGLLLFAVAHTAGSGSWVAIGCCALLMVLLTSKARWEEARLTLRFPEYPDYARRTGRFMPRLVRRGA